MDPDLLRIALRAILAAWVAEIPDQFLFLGVDRDHRLLFRQSRGHLGVDVAKLRIPVGMAIALRGLAVALQAVARIVEQSGDQGAAHRVALRLERWRQSTHTLASTATAIPGHRASSARPALRDPAAGWDPWRPWFCLPLPAAERAPRAPPTPIPSAPARSCSVQSRSPSRPPQSLHNPRRTPRPPRPDDGPVRQETAPPSKTALEWARHRSQPPYMVSKDGCKLYIHSIRSRSDNFRSGPKLMRRPIIIDTDPGLDDAVAILLALAAADELE